MGIYVDPKNVAFRKALNADIYIDKTELIAYTNDRIDKTDCFLCVSRPRRFGKSMAAAMLAAYYSRGCSSKKLFGGLKASENKEFTAHLNQYDVIYLNIQQFLSCSLQLGELPECIETEVMRELKEEYGFCRLKSMARILPLIYLMSIP